MLRKIVIAADSFKGSLTSAQFAQIAARAVADCLPGCELVQIALGDGGEGTLDALAAAISADVVNISVHDPLMRPVSARFAIREASSTAIVELAQASGLPLLSEAERNPLLTTTYGTGELIAEALRRGCRRIYIGIGGSATNDGGMGLLTALGYKFYDADDALIDSCGRGCDLEKVARVERSLLHDALCDTEIIVACDVTNPLCGPNGASHVFGPQKGADTAMCARLDIGMGCYARVLAESFGRDMTSIAGGGAAGGVGACLSAVFGARLMPGIDMLLEAVDFKNKLTGADLVITGEGRLDAQTPMGKTPFGVLKAARRAAVPVVALGGQVIHCPELDGAGFAAVLSIQSGPCSLAEALSPDVAARNLSSAVSQIVSLISACSPDRCG